MPAPPRPFRFGVQVSGPAEAAGWVAQARRVEDLGYSTLTIPDHFTDQLAPLPALSTAAAVTTTLRVGALVCDNDYKHPLVLAKELATQDVLSGGRVEIGLGAGWLEADYRAAGMPYDRPAVRIDRFEEGVAVIKGAMGDRPFSFAGAHYAITEYDGRPKPLQRPHPPLLIGGGGRRLLTIAAREADVVGINGNLAAGVVGPAAVASMTREAVAAKVALVREAAGHRFAEIEMSIRVWVLRVTDDAAGEIDAIAGFLDVPPAMVAESPFALIGTAATIADTVRRRREELGFSYVIVGGEDIEPFAPVVAALAGT
jgi:probable F420-dependent oxidoreductase